jgi:hypothetical protein
MVAVGSPPTRLRRTIADTSRDEDPPEPYPGSTGGCGATTLATYDTATTSSAWIRTEPTTPSE